MTAIKNILDILAGPFCVGFQEHFQNLKYGNGKFKFAQHLIHNKHSIAPTEDIMEILHITKKRKYDEHP